MTVSIRTSLVLSALALTGLTAAFNEPPVASENEKARALGPEVWSYNGETGPDNWGSLSPASKACAQGMQQSPVDLTGAIPATLSAPEGHWMPSRSVMVTNTGRTLQIDLLNAGSMKLGGKEFFLKEFHFHHPSEHTIDGRQFPLEAHFVHTASDGEVVVAGVLFAEGAANAGLDPVWATAPARPGKAAVAFEIDASAFLAAESQAFRYEGSLTTPPCTENVHWVVMAKLQTVSPAQLAAYSALFSPNARPPQAINRRYVLKTGN